MIEAQDTVGSRSQALLSRRDFLVAGGLAATALVPAVLTRRSDLRETVARPALDSLVPDKVGPWQRSLADGVLIPRGEEGEQEAYDEVVTRYYTSDTAAPIMLLIAYGRAQTHHTQLHRPEVCYPGAGFTLKDWPDISLKLPGQPAIAARVLTATAPGRIEQILYWSRVGKEFPTRNLAQRWSVSRQTLSGAIPDGALVRMSMIEPNPVPAVRALEQFAAALVSAGSSGLRQLLTG